MARISKMRGRTDGNSGYTRVLGDSALGALISRIQAATISAGSELERIITASVDSVDDLDSFLEQEIMAEGVLIATKKQVKKSTVMATSAVEPDFVVFRRRRGKQVCYVIELKDGDTFDTKKVAGEYASLQSFVNENGKNVQYRMQIHVVSFNQDDIDAIYDGFKRKIPKVELMTGRQFCELLEISYDDIVSQRKVDAEDNFDHFLTELLSIDRVREYIQSKLEERRRRSA